MIDIKELVIEVAKEKGIWKEPSEPFKTVGEFIDYVEGLVNEHYSKKQMKMDLATTKSGA